MLEVYDSIYNSELLIWACECRNSDKIMVVVADKSCSDMNNMFDDKAWESAKYFKVNDYDAAVEYAYNVIKKQFGKNFLEDYSTKFKMHKCLADLQKIAKDSKNFVYEDYYDLATFEVIETSFFCDLVINEGKIGLRYSKYTDIYHEELDNLFFEEWEPDLTNSVSLMLGMQEKLNNFIENEINYNIEIAIPI